MAALRPSAGLLLLILLAAGAVPVAAQGPAAPWQTLATPHFRLHYPAPFAAWAARAAAWLEAVRARDIAEIGFTPRETVDVVISDPQADANGAAIPIRGWPRMLLWTSPPPPDSETGHFRDWIEDLVVHEEAHLVHLLRPSRNPLLAKLLPISPIAAAPRWVIEGYATLVEGRLTGAGRPNGDMRASILRRWAAAGVLPSYASLAGDSHGFQGNAMAYMAGSAYLEWLDRRGGPDGPGSLRRLWARMTARTPRDFDEAFRGVWGDSPEKLYDRFKAELTWQALEVEHKIEAAGPPETREGAPWQYLTWATGAPAVSPDGARLALVRSFRDRPPELVVWSTAPDPEAEKRWQQAREDLLRRDPQDIPAVRTRPLARKPLATWAPADAGAPEGPRFLPGGDSLLFTRRMPDREGTLHPDLFQWWPATGQVRRLTREADLRDPDPGPDGRWAVAVRDRWGASQLVAVDLATGAVQPLTAPAVERIYDRPRLAPGGRRVAFALHTAEGGAWKVALLDLQPGPPTAAACTAASPAGAARDLPAAAGAEIELPAPAGTSLSSPAWSSDGRTLYAVAGSNGFLDLCALSVPAGAPGAPDAPDAPDASGVRGAGVAPAPPHPLRLLTRTLGAALAPAPTPDGKALFYLSLEPDGLSLYSLDLATPHPPLGDVAVGPDLAPAVRPAPPAAVPPATPALSAPPAPAASAPSTSLPPPAAASLSAAAASRLSTAQLAGEIAPAAAAAQPYGAGRLEWLPLLAGAAANASSTLEMGVRGGDLIGRLDLLALGAIGSGGGLRGGTVAGAWRGWPVDLRLQVFDARDAPSAQSGPALANLSSLDLERRGASATAEWDRHGAGDRLHLAASALWQRLLPLDSLDSLDSLPAAALAAPLSGAGRLSAPPAAAPVAPVPFVPRGAGVVAPAPPAALPGGPAAARLASPLAGGAGEAMAGAAADYRLARRFGLFRVASDLAARLDEGRTAGGSWTRYGGAAAVSLAHHDDGWLSLAWRRDGSRQVTEAADLYQLGGPSTSLLPSAALDSRIVSPALPAGALIGAEHEEERVELSLDFLPAPLFYERHTMWGGLLSRPAAVSLAGLEYRVSIDPYPIVRLPAIELRVGAARVFSDPLRDGARIWLLSVLRP